jgi:ABC-type glutathione transport system ATPase component
MPEALLQVERLVKRFAVAGPRGALLHAVDDVSLHIAPGESLGLVGESGCGKSTLVRLLARLLDPTEGRILFKGDDLAGLPARRFARTPQRAAIQMVFQDPTDSLNPRFSARDTIAEPCRLLAGMTAAQADARVDEVAAQVGLPAELLARFPHQLSGGQKARVGIARALAPRPQLLILDEPTAALDVSVQAVVLQLLDRLRRDLGLATLFVSHDLNVVRLLTDRVAVMYLGKIVEMGPSASVFDHPQPPVHAGAGVGHPRASVRASGSTARCRARSTRRPRCAALPAAARRCRTAAAARRRPCRAACTPVACHFATPGGGATA